MLILFADACQEAECPDELKSGALADSCREAMFTVTFGRDVRINSIGLGNTDADRVELTTGNRSIAVPYRGKGLYRLNEEINAYELRLKLRGGSYLGRFACGMARDIPLSVMREPAIKSTAKMRRTLSGQVINAAGGYTYREISVELKYRIGPVIYRDIDANADRLLSGLPVFLDFDNPNYPFGKFYATFGSELQFQSSLRHFLYSRKFLFTEAF